MRTRSSSNLLVESPPDPSTSNPMHRNHRRSKQPFILEESPIDTMADQRTMTELLHQFFGLEKDNPHDHIHWLNKITSTIKYKDVPNSTIKLMLFPLSLAEFDESFHEAWDRYNDLLCACPLHGFTELHQLDTFYNALNPTDQDSLSSAAGGNLLERRTQDVLTIIEKKSKCLAAGGNIFPELRDNIQGYVAAAAVNYNQGNSGYRPSRSGSLPSNTIANLKGELKAITTRSGVVLDGPSIPIPPLFINLEEDERVDETLTDQDLAEYTIKVPPPLDAQAKAARKDEVQIHKFWQMFKQLHINITLADALILILKYQKMLKAILSNKEKLLELANTPLIYNCLAVIIKKLPERLGDPRKFFNLCGFNELKCKALTDLANRAICTPAGIARDVFVLVGKFTFLADFVIVDYESDPRVPLILGRHFLRTAYALIDVHREEMILRDEFADELALITFPPRNDDLSFDIEFDLKEIEYPLQHDPIKDIESILKDSVDESNLADLNDNIFLSEYFSEVDSLPSTNTKDKVFNPGILIQENIFEVITHVASEKNEKKLAISHTSLIFEDFDPPLNELPFFKGVPDAETLLSFSSENEEKVFKPGIHTSKEVHFSLIPELSHQGYKVFKIIQILKISMDIFLFSYGENIRILDVHCLHFYPP
nr:hypothetical protein [Tanacetum cinerariifolium]